MLFFDTLSPFWSQTSLILTILLFTDIWILDHLPTGHILTIWSLASPIFRPNHSCFNVIWLKIVCCKLALFLRRFFCKNGPIFYLSFNYYWKKTIILSFQNSWRHNERLLQAHGNYFMQVIVWITRPCLNQYALFPRNEESI